MQNNEGEPVLVGDRVVAVGALRRSGSSHLLLLRGEDVYGELFNTTDSVTTPVEGLTGAQPDGTVTVRGVWTGDAIVDAEAGRGGRGVALPPQIDRRSFPDVDGVPDRAQILRTEVHDACEAVRDGALVALLAARSERGWFGLASAVDVEAVRAALEPVLGPYLHVVPRAWSSTQVWEAQEATSAVTEPLEAGAGWSADGRFRAHMLVHHISPRLAAEVKRHPPGIVHVESWVKRESGDTA